MSDEMSASAGGQVRLRVQDDVLTFSALVPGTPPTITTDSISSLRAVLGQGRLAERALEEAIARTEDIIMPRLRALPPKAELEASGSELAEIGQLLGAGSGVPVSVDTVEYLFNQLADHAGGSVIAWRHKVDATRVALGLVVLREVMHHGRFGSVSFSTQ